MTRLSKLMGILAGILLLSGTADAQSLPQLIRKSGKMFFWGNGSPEGNRLGASVSGLGGMTGDVNGDGLGDIIVGASKWGTNTEKKARGRAFVYDGADNLICSFIGPQTGDNLGTAAAFAGDLTGDGKDEILVGADHHKTGTTLGDAGAVYLYDCASQTILKTFEGQAASDAIGHAVSSLGDVNGDGVPDFAIGAEGRDANNQANSGEVKVYSGVGPNYPVLYTFTGAATNDYFGWSLSAAGDVDNDGRGDLVVGAPFADPNGKSAAGSIYVYSGRTGVLLYKKDGAASLDKFGSSVSGIGDINNDGRDDFIVGANSANGYARVYSGTGSVLYTLNGGSFDQFGISVSGVGDITGDGRADFAIGATWDDSHNLSSNGTVTVYSGATGSPAYVLTGSRGDQQQGCKIGAAGDTNGDGKEDLLVSGCMSINIPNPDPNQNGWSSWVGSFNLYSGN